MYEGFYFRLQLDKSICVFSHLTRKIILKICTKDTRGVSDLANHIKKIK
jgi:hypothetical protein